VRNFRQAAAGIRSGQPDRRDTSHVQRGNDSRIHHACQHRDDNLECRLVCNSQPLDLTFFDAGPLQRRVDFAAGTVDEQQVRLVMPNGGDARRDR
jgi:hypothetical protein